MPSQAFAGRSSQLQRGDGATPTEVFSTIAEVRKITRSGSKADLADVTNMDSGNYREFLPTLLDAGEIALEGNYIPSDITQGLLQADFDGQAKHNWKIVLPAARGHWSFAAYVVGVDTPDLQVDKEATFSSRLKITGAATFAAS
jgi:hypothetical protein